MSTRNCKTALPFLLLAGCISVGSARAQDSNFGIGADAYCYGNTDGVFLNGHGHGEQMFNDNKFKMDGTSGSTMGEPASSAQIAPVESDLRARLDAASNAQTAVQITAGNTATTSSFVIGSGGETVDRNWNLAAAPAQLTPGHLALAGVWEHSPTENLSGQQDHYVFGLLVPF